MPANKLFLLDGMALIYRAHFAFINNPIRNSRGFNTSAATGFTNTLVELLKNRKPTHIAVAFDTPEPTARHQEFPEYKAQRHAIPEDIADSIPIVKDLLAGFNIPVLECPGYEADDIIGTLAHQAEETGGFETYMVTPDKDFAQLVAEHTFIIKPARQARGAEVLGVPEILEKWGTERVDQVIDVLGLWGDASDNIPGVPGIGEKTAKKLVNRFGSVENILAGTGELKGKQKENLEKFADQALLSKRLVTIILDAPVGVSPDDLAVRERDDEKLRALFNELEFTSLGKRLFGGDFKVERGAPSPGELEASGGAKTLEDVPHTYTLANRPDARAALAGKLAKAKAFSFDTETTSLDAKSTRLVGMSFSLKPGEATYVPLPHAREETTAILEEFAGVFSDPAIEKLGHNLKFDLAVLRWHGTEVEGPFFDTMLAQALIEPTQRRTLDYLAEIHLGYRTVPFSSLVEEAGKGDDQPSLGDVFEESPGKVRDYACEDADIALQLAEKLRPMLAETGQERVFTEVESPLIPALVGMEHEGIRVDTDALAEISKHLDVQIEKREAAIFELAGHEFNLNSPKQLGVVLFDELKLLDKPKKTPTGQYVTNEQVLHSLAPHHTIAEEILAYREATKLQNTYVNALPDEVFSRTGRVHTTFNQAVTATGRMQSQNPNLQNIPVRTEQGREIRKAFVPNIQGHFLLSADYSQIELRVMAELSGDSAMNEAFRNGQDVHSATAARVYGVELEDVLPEMRRNAKMVNFGIIYGISAFGLGQRLGIPRRDSSLLIDQYFEEYPGVKAYMDDTIAFARENGYVETITGRRRFLADIQSRNAPTRAAAERTAINTPIQGTAADMIKIAMRRVHELIRREGFLSRMLLQVHDELIFDLVPGEEDRLVPLVCEAMRSAIPMTVPIVVDTGTGANWLEAH